LDSGSFRLKLRINEESELEKRYLKFNLQQLLDIAVNVCDGAQYCMFRFYRDHRDLTAKFIEGTRITKCVEGLHNKAFILKMDNGLEVFAKLPNPNAGPAHFSVASEVATRELVRYPVSFSRYYNTKIDSFVMYSISLFLGCCLGLPMQRKIQSRLNILLRRRPLVSDWVLCGIGGLGS
jgi:hypothetical protein